MKIEIPTLPRDPKKAGETVALFVSDFIRGLGYSPIIFFLRLIIYENGRPVANVSAEFSQRKRDGAVAAHCKRVFKKIQKPEAVAVKFYWSDPDDLFYRDRDFILKGDEK